MQYDIVQGNDVLLQKAMQCMYHNIVQCIDRHSLRVGSTLQCLSFGYMMHGTWHIPGTWMYLVHSTSMYTWYMLQMPCIDKHLASDGSRLPAGGGDLSQ